MKEQLTLEQIIKEPAKASTYPELDAWYAKRNPIYQTIKIHETSDGYSVHLKTLWMIKDMSAWEVVYEFIRSEVTIYPGLLTVMSQKMQFPIPISNFVLS